MGHTWMKERVLGVAVALAGILAVAACSTGGSTGSSGGSTGSSGGGASSTPSGTANGTPTAQSILAQTKQANLKDATFTLTETITSSQGTLDATGNGTMTTSPFRQDLKLSSNATGQQVQSEIITDNTTVYTRTPGQSKWTEVSGAASGASVNPSLNNIANLPGAALVGAATVNGVSTYHLRGSGTRSASGQSVTYSEDLWINKANSQPVKVAYHVTSTQGSVDTALVFTAWNTGVTITPPPASEVMQATAPGTPTP